MTNSKMTRRALLTSVMALVLCFAMLTGTTFAWFTDQETSGNNKIVAGNLDVDLLMYKTAEGAYKSIAGESGAIFGKEDSLIAQNDPTNTLWEPGKTQVVFLAVENKGNLALKYNILVNVVDNGLAEVLEYAILDDVKQGDVNLSTLDWATIKANYPTGAITPGVTVAAENGKLDEVANPTTPVQNETDYFALAVHMKEEADNNYMSTKDSKKSVTIDITVTATQVMAEEDSFDNTYDEKAEFEVNTPSALLAALAAGGTVVLEEDIVADSTITIPAGTNATLDLNGKKIVGSVPKSAGHVLVNEGDLKIVGGTIESTANNGGSAIYNKGTLVVSDVEITGAPKDGSGWPSYAINNSGDLTVNNATITSNHGSVSSSSGGKVTLNNVDITMNGIGGSSHIFYLSDSEVIVNGGTYIHNGNIDGSIAYVMSGATFTVNNGEFSASNGGYGMAAKGGNVVINGGVINNALFNWGGDIIVTGGTFKFDPTSYVTTGHKVTDNGNGTWTVARDYTAVPAPSTNTAEQNGTALADAINATTENTFLQLGAGKYKMPSINGNKEVTIVGTTDTVIDVTLGAYMESSKVAFEGVTIKGSTGMANGNGSDYAALYTPNVTYTNCTFEGPFRIGRDGATFINCTFNSLGNDYVWTYGNDATFKNCTFNTDGKALLIYSDGGNEVSKVTVENCVFNSTQGAKASAIANQNCAAIEIHNYGNGVDLTTSGNTYDSNFSGEWRIKTYESGKPAVFVNGTKYTQIAIDGKLMTIDTGKNVTVID